MPWKRGQKLHLVTPEEACPEVAAIYSELKAALGVPFVDKLHQAYGVFPDFLQAHWEQIAKLVGTKQFFQCADRLGADAYTRVHSYLSVPDIASELSAANVSEAARHEIRNTVELFSKSSTYSLLLCAWQLQAFEGPVGENLESAEPAKPHKEVERPMVMRDDQMPESTKKTLDDIRKECEAPALDTFYVAMARWQDLFQDFWRRMQGEMASPIYDHCKQAIRDYSEQLCDELPGPLELTTVQLIELMDEPEIGSMVRITEAFEKSMSALVLNATWTLIALEGGNAARKSGRIAPEVPRSPSAA